MTQELLAEAREIAKKIEKFYAEDKYTDIDGNVWLGSPVDERWYMEGCEMDEDPKYWLTNNQMMKKMTNELSGAEQFRRDEAERREARYEYAVQRSSITRPGVEFIVGNYWGEREERQTALDGFVSLNGNAVKYWLVRRLKAGPVEKVPA